MKTKIQSLHSILTLIVAASAVAAMASSCSTTRGFGRDLQKLGSGIEQEANEHL